MFYSIAADVCDYEKLHSGSYKAASISVVWDLMGKYATLFSTSLPMAILGLTPYQPHIEEPQSVKWAIKGCFIGIPFLSMFSCSIFMCVFPLERNKHLKVLQGIEQHTEGKTATDPITGSPVPPPETSGETAVNVLDYFKLSELEEILEEARNGAGAAAGVERVLRRIFCSLVAYGVTFVFLLVSLICLLCNPEWNANKKSTFVGMMLIMALSTLVCLLGYDFTRYTARDQIQEDFPTDAEAIADHIGSIELRLGEKKEK